MSKITDELTRPIIGIENRTGQEVFDIMADRFRALRSKSEAVGVPTVAAAMAQLDAAIEAENRHHARRNEMLATLIANIEKSEPTPEFAIALREYVRTERPNLTHPAPATVVSDATHRHVKRGSEYALIGIGKMQSDYWTDGNGHVDMQDVAIYRSVDDGSLWVRPHAEFEDGRFAALVPEEGA